MAKRRKKMRAPIKLRTETVTPAMAKAWLKKNTKNRKVKKKIVARYAHQMKQGEWELTGEAICFSNQGILLNGQHRLWACIEADTPFQTAVARGVHPDALGKYDTGTTRQASDVLQMEGYSYTTTIASAVRTIKGITQVEDEGAPLNRIRWTTYVSHTEILEFVKENHALLIRGAEIVKAPEAQILCRPHSLFCALYYMLASINETRAEEFFEMLALGENLTRTHPVWVLRQTLSKMIRETHGKRRRSMSHPHIAAMVVKAWNAWMLGKTVKVLRQNENEAWPRITRRKKK